MTKARKTLALLIALCMLICALPFAPAMRTAFTAVALEPEDAPSAEHVHTPGESERYNENTVGMVAPKGYDEDIYCADCGEWMDYNHVELAPAQNPVVRVSAVYTKDLIRGADSYETTVDIWENGEYVRTEKYDYYNLNTDDVEYTVTMKDGSVFTGNETEIENQWRDTYGKESYYFWFSTDQDQNHWTLGQNKATVSVMDVEAEITVNVVETPVKSVTAVYKKDLIQGADCYPSTHEVWEDGELIKSETFDYYNLNTYDMDLTVTMKDGNVFRGNGWEIESAWENTYGDDSFPFRYSSNQEDKHWTLGQNKATVNVAGFEAELTVNVVKNPVASVTAKQVRKLIENADGYSYEGGPFRYQYADALEYTVTYNDGRPAKTGSLYDFYEEDYQIDLHDDQGDKSWHVGDNPVTVSYMGVSAPVNVRISENPVKSVTAFNVRPISDTRDGRIFRTYKGYDPEKGEQYEESWGYPYGCASFEFKVDYKDGTSKTFTYFPDGKYDGYQVIKSGESFSEYITPDADGCVTYSYLNVPFKVKLVIDEKRPANKDFHYYVQNGLAYITQYLGSAEDVVVPAQIDGIKVGGLLSLNAFDAENAGRIKTLTVSDGITRLGDYFISDCYNLKTVRLGADVAQISPLAFGDYTSLRAIEVSEKNPAYKAVGGILYDKAVTKIVALPPYALRDAETGAVLTYKVPDTVADIDLFLNTWDSRDVEISAANKNFVIKDGVTYNKDMTEIYRCDREKAGAYVMPETVKYVYPSAFSACEKLENVKFSPNVTEIVYATFADCKAMKSVEIPAAVKRINEWAFYGAGLETITLQNPKTVIDDSAFSCCPAKTLKAGGVEQRINPAVVVDAAKKQLRIPDTVTYIVYGLNSLRQEYPDYTITSIGDSVLSINPDSVSAWELKDVADNAAYIGNALIRRVDPADKNPIRVRAGTRIIANNAFAGSPATSVTLPDSLKIIGSYAFTASDLTAVTLPAGLERIGYMAFAGTKLKEIHIPASVTEIGSEAFMDTKLEKITVDAANPAYTVLDGILYTKDLQKLIYCPAGKSGTLKIPASVAQIDSYAFNDNTTIDTIYMTDRMEYFSSYDLARREFITRNDAFTNWNWDSKDRDTVPLLMLERFSPVAKRVHWGSAPYNYYENPAVNVTDGDGVVFNGDGAVRAEKGTTAQDVLGCTDAAYIVGKDGKQVDPGAKIGTGMKLVKVKDGKVTGETEIVVPGDVDGDGDLAAGDARLALRRAVGLETYAEKSAQFKACDVERRNKVQAGDARLILRAAVNLENPDLWVGH